VASAIMAINSGVRGFYRFRFCVGNRRRSDW
jgi:hypothetical protein